MNARVTIEVDVTDVEDDSEALDAALDAIRRSDWDVLTIEPID